MIYLSLEQIIELHDALIEKFGGLLGIRERGLLEISRFPALSALLIFQNL